MTGRTLRTIGFALAFTAASAAIARADGLPVLGFASAAHGVRTSDGTRRYEARPKRHDTIVTGASAAGRILARAAVVELL